MDIDWGALVEVAVVAFAFGVGVVTVFSLGILGVAGWSTGAGQAAGGVRPRTPIAAAVAVACFAACAAAVAYGLWLIVPQFHK